jgi:hypothetical protein
MKPKLKLQRLLPWAAMLVLFTMFSITSAKAQCPDDSYHINPPISQYQWYGEFCTTQRIPNTQCDIEICYCRRSIQNDVTQIYITSVTPSTDGGCDGLSYDYIIKQSRTLVMNDVAGPCIKGVAKVVEVYTAQCWHMHPLEAGGTTLRPCTGVAWCRKTCYVCADNQGVHISGCTTDPQNISQICNDLPPVWQAEQCYTITCED